MAFSFKKDYRAILSVFNFRLLFILVETVLIYFLYNPFFHLSYQPNHLAMVLYRSHKSWLDFVLLLALIQ